MEKPLALRQYSKENEMNHIKAQTILNTLNIRNNTKIIKIRLQ